MNKSVKKSIKINILLDLVVCFFICVCFIIFHLLDSIYNPLNPLENTVFSGKGNNEIFQNIKIGTDINAVTNNIWGYPFQKSPNGEQNILLLSWPKNRHNEFPYLRFDMFGYYLIITNNVVANKKVELFKAD